MTRINPFENYFEQSKIGGAGNINAPEKIDGQNAPKEMEETRGANGIEKSDENDFVDMSHMVDDSADFNMEDLEKSSEVVNDFLDKKKN